MTAKELWKEYSKNKNLDGIGYDAWQFGTDADKLAELVVSGLKTATCSLYAWYQDGKEKLPQSGNYQIILNSKNEAVCIIKTTRACCLPYCDVTKEHAYKEGEGDRSLAYWRMVHKAVFEKESASVGKRFSDNSEVVCEEFECIYVPHA